MSKPAKKNNLKPKSEPKKIRFKFGWVEIVKSNSGDDYPYRVTYDIPMIHVADRTLVDSLRAISRVLNAELISMHLKIDELEEKP